jgi:hypothetical protein
VEEAEEPPVVETPSEVEEKEEATEEKKWYEKPWVQATGIGALAI